MSQKKRQTKGLIGAWKVESSYGKDVRAAEAVIQFQQRNTLAGNTGCNTLFGSYEVNFDSGSLIFRNLMSTKMACSGIKNDCEQLFLKMTQLCLFFKSTESNVIQLLDKDKKVIGVIRKMP